ncbi:MAG: family 78 glycoside hydrolase catalytic domain, partial [Promethearchaeota archaeon]
MIIPINLKCEYQVNPLGVDLRAPRLSWTFLTNDQDRNKAQSAYRILVASSKNILDDEQGDLWDSGKIYSGKSTCIDYQGKTLLSRSTCYWKVMVWDERGEPSNWSKTCYWVMGILKEQEWEGKWIGADVEISIEERFPESHEIYHVPDDVKKMIINYHRHSDPENPHAMGIYLRREFSVPLPDGEDKSIERVLLRSCGLGYYEIYINGHKANDSVLEPAFTDYSRRVYYSTWDVTGLLHGGKNCIGVILGNGFYFVGTPDLFEFEKAPWAAPPKLILELDIIFRDGSLFRVASDSKWQFTKDGPIRFNCVRSGEAHDARMDLGRWSEPGGIRDDDERWHSVKIVPGPAGKLVARNFPVIKIHESLEPIHINTIKEDVTVYHFPENIAGWVKITVRGRPGQKILLKHNERLNPDGTVNIEENSAHTYGRFQTDEYTCKGDGLETWHPHFTYHGFQFVQVEGIKKDDIIEIVAQKVHTDVKPIGKFECSNDLINKIQDIALRTYLNALHSIPQDCPQREKAGWTEDGTISSQAAVYNFDTTTIYEKWVRDMMDAQVEWGQVPDIVPTPGWSKPTGENLDFIGTMADPWWGGAIILLTWTLYLHHGNKRILEELYPSMKRYLSFLEESSVNYIISWPTLLGDWLEVGADGSASRTPRNLTATQAFFLYSRIMEQISIILKKNDDLKNFQQLSGRIRDAFNDKFFNEDGGYYAHDSQSAQAMSLLFELVPSNKKKKVLDYLKSNVMNKWQGHLSTGIVGTYFLFHALSKNNLDDVA